MVLPHPFDRYSHHRDEGDRMTTSTDLIVCKTCFEETRPTTIEAIELITCDTEVTGNITHLRCKSCHNIIYTVLDHGAMSFGDDDEVPSA